MLLCTTTDKQERESGVLSQGYIFGMGKNIIHVLPGSDYDFNIYTNCIILTHADLEAPNMNVSSGQ